MKLVFIYNADSGKINTWLDIGHKLLSPGTYSCSLCALTHGILHEKEEWKKYRAASGLDLEFLHKDEFEKKYSITEYSYPIVLKSFEEGGFEVFIPTEEIQRLESIEALIQRLPGA